MDLLGFLWVRNGWRWPVAGAAALFGAATIVSGGRVLFGPETARAAAGHYLPWLVAFNFAAGFAYLVAAAALAGWRSWGVRLAEAIAAATLLAAAGFGLHVAAGGPFELRTVVAMALRAAVWGAIAWGWRRRVSGSAPSPR